MIELCFREFFLNEMVSIHAGGGKRDDGTVDVGRVRERIQDAARLSPEIIPNPEELIQQAIRNIRIAERIFKGPKSFAIEILPEFPRLLATEGPVGSWKIPRTQEEGEWLRKNYEFRPIWVQGKRVAKHGSVGNVLVAILEPPKTTAQKNERAADQLETVTVKFERNSKVVGNTSNPVASQYISYNSFLNYARKAQQQPVGGSPVAAPQTPITARELLDPSHPKHPDFITWLDGKEPSKRKASEFLRLYGR